MLGVLVAVLLELNRLVTLGRQQTYVLMQEKQAIVCTTRRRPGGCVLSWDADLLHITLTLHAGSCWTQVLLCLS